jgi:hypothetical protein
MPKSRPKPLRHSGVPGDAIEGHELRDAAVTLDDDMGRSFCLRIAQPRDRAALGEPAGRVVQDDERRFQAAALVRRRQEGHRLAVDRQPAVGNRKHTRPSLRPPSLSMKLCAERPASSTSRFAEPHKLTKSGSKSSLLAFVGVCRRRGAPLFEGCRGLKVVARGHGGVQHFRAYVRASAVAEH